MKYYSEKRNFIRMRMETPITFELDGTSYAALCIDLSSTGLQIETEARLEFNQGNSCGSAFLPAIQNCAA